MIPRERLETQAYTALRIIAGALFAFEGMQKVFGLFATAPPLGSQLWIGGVIELVTGPLIALGLFTRIASFVAAGQMAVAYFQYHWGFHLDRRILPVANGGDLAIVNCFVFLLIWARGAGPYSLDRQRGHA